MKNRNLITAILSIIIFATFGYGQEQQTVTLTGNSGSFEKPAGTIRIGIVTPKAGLGEAASAEIVEGLRTTFTEYLKGPTVDVVAIEAKSASNVAIEAGQKGCDYVLYSSLSKKTKTSLFGSLIKAAVPVVAGQVPAGSTNQSAMGEAQQAASETGKSVIDNLISAKFGAKDEITLEFTLTTADGKTPVAKGSPSGRAKADGGDIVSALIEQASEKVLQSAIKK
jgi:hypothetical protein